MKLYEKMREWENMSWCRPYTNENCTVAINGGKVVGYRVNGHDVDASEFNFDLLETMRETGCCECPWKDECEVMDDVEDVRGLTAHGVMNGEEW